MKRLTDPRLAMPPGEWREVTLEERKKLQEIPVPLVTDLYYRLASIEDILGDEYELDDLKKAMWSMQTLQMTFAENTSAIEWLRELWFADREGRCVVLPIKIPGWGWYCNDKFPNAISAYFDRPSQVVDCIEDYILRGTKEQAEAALKAREQE